jgi:hypothetical protein
MARPEDCLGETEMLRVILNRLLESLLGRIPEESRLERDALRDLKQVAGSVVAIDSLCVWVGPAGRYLKFDPPLDVRILRTPERMIFDSLTNWQGETLVLYAVEALAPQRLPEGAGDCLIDGPSYGHSSITRPSWWGQMALDCLETWSEDDSRTDL